MRGVCALNPGSTCESDLDCEVQKRCFRDGSSGESDEISDVECGEDLDCAALNAPGFCVNGLDFDDMGTPCTSKLECLPTYGVCEGENEGAECADRCECGVSCETKCVGYQKAECQGAKVFECEENTCEGQVASNFGTPGAPNPVCPFVAVDSCLEGEAERDIRFPQAGDLILTEVFADPSSTDLFPTNSDDGREWLEIYINSTEPVDLNGLEIRFTKTADDGTTSTRTAKVSQPSCLGGSVGTYVVLGESEDAAVNGGVEVDGIVESLDIYNNEELLVELVIHEIVIIDVAALPKSTSGKSTSLSPGAPNPNSNDSADAFCKSESAGLFSQGGTPGSANACSSPVGCEEEGQLRGLVPPAIGELVISELLFDPSGSDGEKEWIELYNGSERTLDLNGLSIVNYVLGAEDNIKKATVGGVSCVKVEPGEYAVVGATDDVLMNGNLTVTGSAENLSFYNSAPGVVELYLESVLVERAVYPDSSGGSSVSLKPEFIEAGDNEDSNHYCESKTDGAYEGLGTPGSANVCGPACVGDSGKRQVRSPRLGELVVTELMANPSGSDSGWEWFEIYINSDVALDLNGLKLVAGNGNSTREREIENQGEGCITVQPGAYSVVGGDMVNTLFPVDATWGSAELFYNSNLTFELHSAEGDLVDTLPGPFQSTSSSPAKSYVLGGEAGLDAGDNDDVSTWCKASVTTSSLSFHGSPGLPNEACH